MVYNNFPGAPLSQITELSYGMLQSVSFGFTKKLSRLCVFQ